MQFLSSILRFNTVWLVWLMVLIADLGVEIVVSEDHPSVVMLLGKVMIAGCVTAYLLKRSLKQNWQAGGLTVFLAFLAMFGPMIGDPLWHWVCGHGHSFELKLIIGLRNLAFILLNWSTSERFEKLTAVLSLFTVLFAVATSQDHSMPIISAVYLFVAISWLCTSYWASLKTQKVKGQQKVIPWFTLTSGLAVLIVILILFVMPESNRARLAAGFMPSSGGDGAYDPFARSGIRDGENLVAGTTEAMTFAPLEEAPFIEGQKPSLYDVVQETYGEPKIPINQQKAIAIAAEQFKINHHRMAEAKKSAKSFALHRKGKKSGHRHLKDTETKALFHVLGRVPVHIKHTVYDLFDGQQWYPEELREDRLKKIKVKQLDEKPWITWDYQKGFYYIAGIESHALRIVNFETNRIVSPANTIGVHIDRCDRTDLFCWIQDDILGMNRESLPNLSVIHLQSRMIDESQFDGEYPPVTRGNIPAYNAYPSGDDWQQVRSLAERWTRECKTDWERVQTICRNLRERYFLDSNKTVPDTCDNPVHWFLLESQTGSDYLFASSAVLLIRSLGISSRAVSGFYADEHNYDVSARQTSVYKSNLHWWPEVYLGAGCWQTIEPTPGYSVLQPKTTLMSIVVSIASHAYHYAVVYWPVSLMLLMVSITIGLRWNQLLARLLTWHWMLRNYWFGHSRKTRSVLLEMIKVWDRRLQLAGLARPGCSSVSSHILKSQQSSTQLPAPVTLQLSRLCDWAIYSATEQPPIPIDQQEVRRLCYQWLTNATQQKSTGNISHL